MNNQPTLEEIVRTRNELYARSFTRNFTDAISKSIRDVTPSNIYKQFGYVMIANCLDRIMMVACGSTPRLVKCDWTYFKRFAKMIEPGAITSMNTEEMFIKTCKPLAAEGRHRWINGYVTYRASELGKQLPHLPNLISMFVRPSYYQLRNLFGGYNIHHNLFGGYNIHHDDLCFFEIADMIADTAKGLGAE